MKLGFIGAGNMGGAIIRGYVKQNPDQACNVYISEYTPEFAKKVAGDIGVNAAESVEDLVQKVDTIVLAVKPNMFDKVVPQVKAAIEACEEEKRVISIAAGITIDYLKNNLPEGLKIIRVMPNTPAMVNEGMTALFLGEFADEAFKNDALKLFESCGKVEIVSESLIHAVIGASGSSPAYTYMFIEAIADAVVAEGMPRAQAYKFAAQAVLGAAKMVLETGKHPGELKDNVCSPGGTTIQAVISMEQMGLRAAVMQGIKDCCDKSREMSGE
ncbi:MAG: pyrroline-5-carboxylate reductase [Firmicutes bacterium]|nr:pyrroline-5-carboxylate reductase [Bacillota bacterium]